MKKITTDDGSITFYNEDVDEQYHSTSGAFTEALEKHVKPSKILEKKDEIVIVDFCFGLGYNTIVAISEILKKNPKAHIQIFAFEKDPKILQELSKIKFPDEYAFAAKKVRVTMLNELEEGVCFYQNEQLTITLYLGDAAEKTKVLADDIADVVFFDPFSPKKQPELWSTDVFTTMNRILAKGGVLTTYSCAKQIRENMQEAGFEVVDGPIVGRNSPGTLGIKQ